MKRHYLRQVIADNEINSFESLYEVLGKNSADKLHLNLVTKASLRLDSENRNYETEISFQSKVIKSDYAAKNSEEISFVDCVIDGNLSISDNSKTLKSVFFDYLVVKERVVLNLKFKTKVVIHGLNCKYLKICGGTGCVVDISNSNIFHILLEGVDFSSFRCTENKICKIELSSAVFASVEFDYKQLDFSLIDVVKDSRKYRKKYQSHDLFSFVPLEDAVENIYERSSCASRRETLSFLLNNPDIQSDRNSLSRLRALHSQLYLSNSKPSYFLMLAVGNFTKPSVFLMYFVVNFLLFASVFYLSALDFSVNGIERPLLYSEALFFSGTTMTTLGSGDIEPLGLARVLYILEGVFGVLIMSSFIVAMYRKYVER
jgi:hypothetical protein